MSKIKFEVEIDTTNPYEVMAAITFMQTVTNLVNPGFETKIDELEKKVSAKLEAVKTSKSIDFKKATEKKKAEAAKEQAKKEPVREAEEPAKEDEASDGPEEGAPDITLVRKVLSTKVDDHRDAIKTKLTELDAKSVSTLESKHFQEFLDFLNDL